MMHKMTVRREENLERVAARWGYMVGLCDQALSRLETLAEEHPACGAVIYYDRVFQLKGKCQRLQEMHTKRYPSV
ncbi:MAG TPA: hypothetical protein VG146_07135 [Verrucomicrobiae bacterium]|nr:hypothetical protein [Verrucomicrobiae bacterium]